MQLIAASSQRRAYRQKNGRKPRFRINQRPAQANYVNPETEKVIEFWDPSLASGGLIMFSRGEESLRVTIYRHSRNVFVGEGQHGV